MNSIARPGVSRFSLLPIEIILLIAHYLLDDDVPPVGARGLLLEDSYIRVLRAWRDPGVVSPEPCTPPRCCHTRRGARSGQTVICFKDDFGPARSALDLLSVCRNVRRILLADALFWGQALLLRPSLLDDTIDRALKIPVPRLSFTAHGGICLCALSWLIHNIEFVIRIDVALPSTNIDGDDSPSHMISTELSKGAPNLQAVDLRFDWAHAHDDAAHKTIICLPSVQTSRLLNATFAIASVMLTSLHMSAEEVAFRWRRLDIYRLLRACPNIDSDVLSVEQQMVYPDAGIAVLPRLDYFLISDTLTEWQYASASIQFSTDARVHADVILPMSRLPGYSTGEFQLHCDAAMTSRNLRNIGLTYKTMAVRMRRALSHHESKCRWPEYMSLSFGETVPSAMAFRDSVHQKSAGSFTVRNAALSLTHVDTPWVHMSSGGVPYGVALDVMMRGSSNLGIRYVETFVLDATHPFLCPERWRELITHLPAVRRIVMYGPTLFSSPKISELARALGQGFFVVDVDEDQEMDEAYPCPNLVSIQLPDASNGFHHAAISLLNGILNSRYKVLRRRISWEV